MTNSVRTKLATIYGQNCTFQTLCCKTNANTTLQLRNVQPAPCGMHKSISTHIHTAVFFTKLEGKNTLIFTTQLCCDASDSMLGKIKGLFKNFWQSRTFPGFTIKCKDFSRLCELCSIQFKHLFEEKRLM